MAYKVRKKSVIYATATVSYNDKGWGTTRKKRCLLCWEVVNKWPIFGY